MIDYQGKVVAITGAASGIGRELASRLGKKGARLSLADINEAELSKLTDELKADGMEFIAQRIDVTVWEDVQRFSDASFDTYGTVDFLFNCAGASTGGMVTDAYMKDFDWVFAVNTLALVYAAKTFVRRMVKQDKECHVINTLSIAAFLALKPMQPYSASKAAGLAISQSLEWQLRDEGSKVKVHCLCPAFVATNFGDIENNRSPQFALDEEGIAFKQSEAQIAANALSKQLVLAGIPVQEAVDIALQGIEEDRFIIHTHPQSVPFLKKWWNNLLDGKPGYTDNALDMSIMIKQS